MAKIPLTKSPKGEIGKGLAPNKRGDIITVTKLSNFRSNVDILIILKCADSKPLTANALD